ncbi:cytochrome P450 4C1-like isoform X2 [Temnothorax longispinosus]|uniref:cytochrome P450 4C1-like isoform X2 n=1 Tax=Temnothorax longispinosus TaxID=300112 RepID=UPI003A99D89E
MIITTLLLLFLIALVYNYYVHHRKNGRLINLIPGIPGYPIFGNIVQYLCSPEEYWKLMTNISDEYYSIFKIWVFFTPYVLIRHPDDLKAILNSAKHIDKSGVYHVLHRLVGTGLSTSKGAKWHSRRNILAPLFHFNILQQFVEILFEQSENMTKSLKDIRGAVVKDSVSFVSEYTLNALCGSNII